MRVAVRTSDMSTTNSRTLLKVCPTAWSRPCPKRRAMTINNAATSPAMTTIQSSRMVSASARAATSVVPTRARNAVSVACRSVSLTSRKMMGRETAQTVRIRVPLRSMALGYRALAYSARR